MRGWFQRARAKGIGEQHLPGRSQAADLTSWFDVSWVRVDWDIFNGVKQDEVFCMVADENRQKQGKNVEKKTCLLFLYYLHLYFI